MKRPGLESRLFFGFTVLAVAVLGAACTWEPWLPGEGNWEPPPEVAQAPPAEHLALGSVRVADTKCFARRCERRYRVVVDESGTLIVQLVPELLGPDAQIRLVLEGLRGVLGQASTGRGATDDVEVLAVQEVVAPGVYFALVQSLGGPTPYEIGATLIPGPGPGGVAPPPTRDRLAEAGRALPDGPAPELRDVDLGGRAKASYDPAVGFESLRSFSFAPMAQAGDDLPAGTVIEQPGDRQIRRFIAEDLRLKGLRQPSGDEPADLIVEFRTSNASQMYRMGSFPWYDLRDRSAPQGDLLNEAGRLTIAIFENESGRIAWHGWSEKSLGPGTRSAEAGSALAREAVSDILADFPPR